MVCATREGGLGPAPPSPLDKGWLNGSEGPASKDRQLNIAERPRSRATEMVGDPRQNGITGYYGHTILWDDLAWNPKRQHVRPPRPRLAAVSTSLIHPSGRCRPFASYKAPQTGKDLPHCKWRWRACASFHDMPDPNLEAASPLSR